MSIISNPFGMYLCKYTILMQPLDKYWFMYYHVYMFKYLLRREPPCRSLSTVTRTAADPFSSGFLTCFGIRRGISRPVGAAFAAVKCFSEEKIYVGGVSSERRTYMNSPCVGCTRVKDPQTCENKLCKDWQTWFISRWEAMRQNVRAQMEETTTYDIGVPLGGERYAHPHRMREYFREDPCRRCLCPKNACHTPCNARVAWAKIQSGVKE